MSVCDERCLGSGAVPSGSGGSRDARPEDGWGAVLQDWSAAGEVRLCVTLLLAHCINSADVPPQKYPNTSTWKGEGTACCGAAFQRGGALNSEREVGLFFFFLNIADCEGGNCEEL